MGLCVPHAAETRVHGSQPLPQAGHEAETWMHVDLFKARPWGDAGKGIPSRGNDKDRSPEDVPVCRSDNRGPDEKSDFRILPPRSH